MLTLPQFWIFTLVLLLIAGEAIALLLGMVILPKQKVSWANRKNIFFLAMDILLPLLAWLLLIYPQSAQLQLLLLILLGASHAYREVEVQIKDPEPFCYNQPLRLVNLLKLAGILLLLWS